MTCQHAMNRIIRLVQEHRTRVSAEHKDTDTYCVTTKNGRRRK